MKVGIVIGRFQVKELHQGHKLLLEHAKKKSDRLLILLGCSRSIPNRREPLDFKSRQQMIEAAYPMATVLPLFDMANDNQWSSQIINMVYALYPDLTQATLYGGRDSCLDHFPEDVFNKEFVNDIALDSGTLRRESDARYAVDSADFRHGCIYTVHHLRPAPLMCVDIAAIKAPVDGKPYNPENTRILLGKKSSDTHWRFPGGKVDLEDKTLEIAAARELQEETALIVDPSKLVYLYSSLVDDWRFRDNPSAKIMTTLYSILVDDDQVAVAGDDLKLVDWFTLDQLELDDVIPAHKELLAKLKWKLGA